MSFTIWLQHFPNLKRGTHGLEIQSAGRIFHKRDRTQMVVLSPFLRTTIRISGVVDVHNFFFMGQRSKFFDRKMQQKSHHPSAHHQNCRTNTPSTTFLHLHTQVDHLVIGTHSLWENQQNQLSSSHKRRLPR